MLLDWQALETAFELGGAEARAWLDVQTGEVLLSYATKDPKESEEFVQRVAGEPDRYVEIKAPDDHEQHRWMVEFTDSIEDEPLRDLLKAALSEEATSSRLEAVLDEHDPERWEQWSEFRYGRMRDVMERWLATLGLKVENAPPWASPSVRDEGGATEQGAGPSGAVAGVQPQDRTASEELEEVEGPSGIGGWLLLPLLGLVLAPIVHAIHVWKLSEWFEPDAWSELTSVAYHSLWLPLILFETLANAGLLIVSIVLIWLFLKESKRVPRLYIAFRIAGIAVALVHQSLWALIPTGEMEADPTALRNFLLSTFSALAWITYFRVSVRVKNTFVH